MEDRMGLREILAQAMVDPPAEKRKKGEPPSPLEVTRSRLIHVLCICEDAYSSLRSGGTDATSVEFTLQRLLEKAREENWW